MFFPENDHNAQLEISKMTETANQIKLSSAHEPIPLCETSSSMLNEGTYQASQNGKRVLPTSDNYEVFGGTQLRDDGIPVPCFGYCLRGVQRFFFVKKRHLKILMGEQHSLLDQDHPKALFLEATDHFAELCPEIKDEITYCDLYPGDLICFNLGQLYEVHNLTPNTSIIST